MVPDAPITRGARRRAIDARNSLVSRRMWRTSRRSSDGLSGSAGFLVRTVVRGKVEEGLLEGLRKTKQVMEAAR